jgi:hypothetical protein
MIDVIDDLPLTNSPVAKRYQMQKIFGRWPSGTSGQKLIDNRKKKNIKCFKHHWRRTYGKYMLMIWYGKLQTIDFLGYTVTGEISVFKPVIWYSNGCNSPRKSIQYVCANHILECHLHTWWIPEKIPYNHLISVNIMYIYIYLMTII